MDKDYLSFSGVDGAVGRRLLPPMPSLRSAAWPGAGRSWCHWGSRKVVTAVQSRAPAPAETLEMFRT